MPEVAEGSPEEGEMNLCHPLSKSRRVLKNKSFCRNRFIVVVWYPILHRRFGISFSFQGNILLKEEVVSGGRVFRNFKGKVLVINGLCGCCKSCIHPLFLVWPFQLPFLVPAVSIACNFAGNST